MSCTILCLTLVLLFTAESFAKEDLQDIVAKLDIDHDLTSEKKGVEGFEYKLYNFTFHGGGNGGHERVKRWQVPTTSNPLPLCVMTFNIRAYTAPQGLPTNKDIVIAHVRDTGFVA